MKPTHRPVGAFAVAGLFALSVLAATLLTSACASQPKRPAATVVLVHGAFQNAASWAPTQRELERRGARVIAVDLPGQGQDTTALGTVTLDSYVEKVAAVVGAQAEPVILVGHSFGGMTISAVAERLPERISRLVYVAAYLPKSGESMLNLALSDKGTSFTQENFVADPTQGRASVLSRDVVKIFAADLDAQGQAAVLAAIEDNALAPMATPVTLTAERFGRVTKRYLETLEDHALSHDLQTRMLDGQAGIERTQLPTGHLPFVSQPKKVAAFILD